MNNKKLTIEPGVIFCIPLFMPKDDWKLKIKLSEEDLDKDFAFGRVIESNSSVLIEIFKQRGTVQLDLLEIEKSEVLFSPVQVFWDAIVKKRWKVIGKTENYDKHIHSNYANLKMVFGFEGNFRLKDFDTKTENYIPDDESDSYEFSTVWYPIDLENRILEYFSKEEEQLL